MVVVDSSALIPLAWVGRLDLISRVFDDVTTIKNVREEVLVGGKPGTARLDAFLEDVTVWPQPTEADRIAELEGLTVADAGVVLLGEETDDLLLANDKALIAVARSHGVDSWWVTTLLLKCVKDGVVSNDEGIDILYDLVDEGMNLDPKVYAQVQRRLREIGE